MKKFKFQVPKGTRPLTREELKHIYGGIITDVNQYNCSDTVPGQIGACKGKQEGSICRTLPTHTTSSRTAEPQNTLLDLARKEGHVPTFSVSKNRKRGGSKLEK